MYPNYIVWRKDFKRQQAGLKTAELNTNNISQITKNLEVHILQPMASKGWCMYVHICTSCGVYIPDTASQVALVIKNPLANAGDIRDTGSIPVGKIPWRRAWQPTPAFLPEESHGQRSLAGYSPWGGLESDTMAENSTPTSIHQTGVYNPHSLLSRLLGFP